MTDNPFTPLEETWSPEPVKAWRYFWVGPLGWNWEDDRWEVTLSGDIEEWSGPVKYAGQHREPGFEHQSPHTGCLCGVNAVKKLSSHEIRHRVGMWCDCMGGSSGVSFTITMPDPRSIAISPVELAGVVDEYEEGYRAQQATIVGPLILVNGTPKIAAVLANNYGVEVTTEWGQFLKQLEIDEAKEREAVGGHRKADTSDHRGTGAGQSTRAGKGTRHRTLTHILFALGIPMVWLSGASVMAQSDAWWSYAAWVVACLVGGGGSAAYAHFLKDQ